MRSRSIGVGLMAAFVALWCFAFSSVSAQESKPSDGVEVWTEPTDWTETASSTEWGESKPTPAVVHPAIVSPLQWVLSLRGDWDFQIDPDRALFAMAEKGGIPEEEWADARTIQVPGCWEAQGVGEPGISETWDIKCDCNPRPLDHIYMGSVVYRKKVDLPADWKGREIWLKVGGVRTEANFWVNGRAVGVINNYCGTYKFDITSFVNPGETAEIIASVRNDTPSRKGQMNDCHRFGGF